MAGLKVSDVTDACTTVVKFDKFMNKLNTIVDEVPPIKQPMRFGNKAFRDWHALLCVETDTFLADILPEEIASSSIELAPYIWDMFGNITRIDYGTGHELNFIIFFHLLLELKVIEQKDLRAVVLVGFVGYIRVMRKLQTVYMLEPAGSASSLIILFSAIFSYTLFLQVAWGVGFGRLSLFTILLRIRATIQATRNQTLRYSQQRNFKRILQ